MSKRPGVVRLSFCFVAHLSLAALFYHAYRIRYANHIDCFNEQGRCFLGGDEGVLTTAGAFWGLFAFVFACLAAITLLRLGFVFLRRHQD